MCKTACDAKKTFDVMGRSYKNALDEIQSMAKALVGRESKLRLAQERELQYRETIKAMRKAADEATLRQAELSAKLRCALIDLEESKVSAAKAIQDIRAEFAGR